MEDPSNHYFRGFIRCIECRVSTVDDSMDKIQERPDGVGCKGWKLLLNVWSNSHDQNKLPHVRSTSHNQCDTPWMNSKLLMCTLWCRICLWGSSCTVYGLWCAEGRLSNASVSIIPGEPCQYITNTHYYFSPNEHRLPSTYLILLQSGTIHHAYGTSIQCGTSTFQEEEKKRIYVDKIYFIG